MLTPAPDASIVSLSADVDIMKQDMNKLTGRANEISQKCPHDHPGFHDVETFVDDVRSFVKFFQVCYFTLCKCLINLLFLLLFFARFFFVAFLYV